MNQSQVAMIAQLFSEDEPPKSQRARLKIIEGAIQCYVTDGVEKATFERIAKASGVSYSLVRHYFLDKRELFLVAIKYIRANMQTHAVAAVTSEQSPTKQIGAYVRSTFTWLAEYPAHFKTWMLFYYYCGVDSNCQQLNQELVDIGHKRIESMLAPLGTGSRSEKAKLIQMMITGALVSMGTERPPLNPKSLEAAVVKYCVSIAQR